MSAQSHKHSLLSIFAGWDTYQASLAHAVAPLSPAQLAWRPAAGLRSVGELASHISEGRITWFRRMDAPGSAALARQAAAIESPEAMAGHAGELVRWLEASWRMIEQTLREWTVDDLAQTYLQPYQGQTYAVSRQWTIWRIMAHDLHHGGELAVMLGMQGIAVPELGDLGGHLTQPPLAESA
jgi:uncharacterized damage-inducible protein DinB